MDENEVNETGETGETEELEESDELEENETGETGPVEEEGQPEVAMYRITGLVDKFDEQMNITGQFPIGSEQELPVEYGDRMVEAGYATKVE